MVRRGREAAEKNPRAERQRRVRSAFSPDPRGSSRPQASTAYTGLTLYIVGIRHTKTETILVVAENDL